MYNFNSKQNRYASVGAVKSLPAALIDSIWMIIDVELKGLVPLTKLLMFNLSNHKGNVTMHFSQTSSNIEMGVDIPYPYNDKFPTTVFAYDDGQNQTVLLPNEIKQA